MPYTPVQLFETQTVPGAATALVTAKVITRIDRLQFNNPSTAPVTVTINMVPSGGTAGTGNQISQKVLNVGEAWPCYDVVNGILGVGDILSVGASTAGEVVVSGSGTQIT